MSRLRYALSCVRCSAGFEARRRDARMCLRCGQNSPTKTCGEAGCDSAVRARGLCSTHYNQQLQPERYKKVTVPCGWCGKSCEKASAVSRGYHFRFCSYDCRDSMRAHRAGLDRCEITKWHPAHPDYRTPLPVPWSPLVVAPPPPRLFVAGLCRHCGKPFVDRQVQARSCSERCTRKYHAKRHKNDVPEATRQYVYERDGWHCQICMKAIRRLKTVPHPLSPTVDHIIPRSEGGDHDPANLRAAHFICNTIRNNRGGNEQLALIG